MIRPERKKLTKGRRRVLAAIVGIALTSLVLVGLIFANSQTASVGGFRIGERLTYDVSFGQFQNVAFAELYTVSRGKLAGHDAIELRSRIKTLDLIGAQFYTIDESRRTFAAPDTGFPLYASKTQNFSVEPSETSVNYLQSPANSYDLLTLIAKIRDAGGVGSFNFSENEKVYTVTLAQIGPEKVKTGAGEFDTFISTVDSSFFTENGLTEVKINLSSDERKLPVVFSFKRKKGIFRASLASVETISSEPGPDPTPVPVVTPTPIVIKTPEPIPTPLPYIDNQPLSADLPFALGEVLEYGLSTAGRPVGTAALTVKERKQIAGKDSLVLTAEIKKLNGADAVLDPSDVMVSHVNPELLSPLHSEFRLAGGLASFSQTLQFDQKLGVVSFGPGKTVDVPVGTQNLLSFLYALRTFNLKQLRDTSNPMNDTRVAVFWDSKAYIFTLRPTNTILEDSAGRKHDCVLVAVNTGNPQLDQLAIKIWLSTDERRLPLRIVIGPYQADLVPSQ